MFFLFGAVGPKEGQLDLLVDGSGATMTVQGPVDWTGALRVKFSDAVTDPALGAVFPLMQFKASDGPFDVPVVILPGLGAGKYLALEFDLGLRVNGELNLVVYEIVGLNDLGDPANSCVPGVATDVSQKPTRYSSGGRNSSGRPRSTAIG